MAGITLTQDQILALTLLIGNFIKQKINEIAAMSKEETAKLIAVETQRKEELMKKLLEAEGEDGQ